MREVAELIVIVSLPAEKIANEFEGIHFGSGVMGAEKENPAMEQNQAVSQRRQWKAPPRSGQDSKLRSGPGRLPKTR